MNKFYEHYPFRPYVRLRPDIARWKSNAKLFVPMFKVEGQPKLSLTMWFHSPEWYYLNGKMKVLDSPNLEKIVIDTMFERWGLNDCLIWHKESWKIEGAEKKVEVMVKELS